MTQASGLKTVTIGVIAKHKHNIAVTPSSIDLPHLFLKNIKTVNQLVASLAHLTAYISLGYAVPPPPKNPRQKKKKLTVGDYLKSAIRAEALDESDIPTKDQETYQGDSSKAFARPRYQNKAYDYTVNKTGIVAAERRLKVDKTADKIMKHAGFCAGDYSRLLHYLYNNPQKFRGSRHFSLDTDQWQRLDVADRRADPAAACSTDQIAQTGKYAAAFNQLRNKILQAMKSGGTN
ncbi:MAG: hypothetical protein GXP02_07515 [Alphaproteobacteria bacterium]|nr:hypothetical protein [Alphaproteobacteria bacterium]